MKGTRPALIICILGLPFAKALSGSQTTASHTFSPNSSSSPSTPISSLDPYATTVTEINMFSLINYPSSNGGLSTPTAAAATSGLDQSAASAPPTSPTSMLLTTSPKPEDMSVRQRNLIIILSSVLGSVGVLLVALAIFLIQRYHRGRSPFSHRGASPINDDEIASWRGTMIDQKKSLDNGSAIREVHHSLQFTHSPRWTWTASPASTRSVLSPTAVVTPETPSFIAIAPNARAGLTDETIPGDSPFIATIKRQSSRLSKAPPAHIRSKSRRSSLSAKSFRSFHSCTTPRLKDLEFPWREPDDTATGYFDSPGTSIFDGLSQGGLAPRPRSRSNQWQDHNTIGRAIS